jgi:hypothetical protein
MCPALIQMAGWLADGYILSSVPMQIIGDLNVEELGGSFFSTLDKYTYSAECLTDDH